MMSVYNAGTSGRNLDDSKVTEETFKWQEELNYEFSRE